MMITSAEGSLAVKFYVGETFVLAPPLCEKGIDRKADRADQYEVQFSPQAVFSNLSCLCFEGVGGRAW